MLNKTYFIKVFGCQYNEWDGARLDFILQKLGLIPSSQKDADVIFLLSCSVRKTAVDRVMSTAKNNLNKKVIVTGCVLDSDKIKYDRKNITLWDINKSEELFPLLFKERSREVKRFNNLAIQQFNNCGSSSSAYLPIMMGCNNLCSYCVVPYVRGPEKSREFDDIISDFKKLVAAGHKEIILLGQNVNSYQINKKLEIKDKKLGSHFMAELSEYKTPFAQLLIQLNNVPGDFKIGFTSNHPKDMTDDIIAAIKDLPKVKKEIHLPVQSGSNKILRAMNRPYTKEQYLELIEKITKVIPDVKLTTDVIIGFPGETEKDFQDTVELFKKIKFAQSYNNKYSPRPGTASFKLGDPIPWTEKQRRWRILNNMVNKK